MPFQDQSSMNEGIVSDMGRKFFMGVGRWGNAPGPGHLMFGVMLAGTASAALFGLAGASIAGAVWGTAALPFVASACAGFVFGAIGFYKDSLNQSRLMLERYPRLLQLHLDANFPQRNFHTWPTDQLRSASFSRNWVMQSMLVTSWLSARPAIEQIRDQTETMLIEGLRTESAGKSLEISDS